MTTSPRGPGHPALGYLEVVGAASLWGSSGIFSVYLFRRGVTPESLAILRPAVGLVFLVLAALLIRRSALRPTRRGLLRLAVLGGGLTAVFQLAYQMSVAAVGVPTTVALLYLAPTFVVAAAGPLLGEWPTRPRIALVALSVLGVWLTVLGARGVDVSISPAGVAWGVTAGATYAGYTLFGRWASRAHGSVEVVIWSTAGACAFLAVALPAIGRLPLEAVRNGAWHLAPPGDSTGWTLLIAFALTTIAVASFLFYDGLGRIEAGRASVATTLEPVVAALLATWLLGQHLTPIGWLGLTLVVTGVAGSYRVRSESLRRRAG